MGGRNITSDGSPYRSMLNYVIHISHQTADVNTYHHIKLGTVPFYTHCTMIFCDTNLLFVSVEITRCFQMDSNHPMRPRRQ